MLVVGTVAGLAYLAVIHRAPKFLAKRQVLAPLFDVGVKGQLAALALRLPHMVVLFLGSWLPFWFFGVKIPVGAALAYVHVLMIIVALPVTPQGVGTRDWFALAYFAKFAEGAMSERESAVAATTLSFAAMISILQAVFGLFLMHRALRILAARAAAASK